MIRLLFRALVLARFYLWRHRRVARAWLVPLALARMVVSALLVAQIVLVLALGIDLASTMALVVAAILTVFLVPHLFIDGLFVRFGRPRLVRFTRSLDPRGGRSWSYLVEARAVARAGSPEAAVRTLLDALPGHLDATGVAAHGLVAAGRGDLADARLLLASVAEVPDLDDTTAGAAAELASDWLAADAAERGDWAAITADASRMPATPLRYLLEGVVDRRAGRGPGRLALALRWLITPNRLATARFLRAETSARAPSSDGAAAQPDAEVAAPTDAPTLLAWAERRRDAASTTAAVTAWAAIVDDPSWVDGLRQRAVALGVAPALVASTVQDARDQLIARLVALAAATRAPLAADAPGLIGAVAYRARGQLLDGLELVLTRCADVAHPRPPIDEWRSFLAARALYEATVDVPGSALDQLAFPHANTALGAWYVALWNVRQQKAMSRAVTQWLFDRARAVGDAAAVEHHGGNLAIVIGPG